VIFSFAFMLAACGGGGGNGAGSSPPPSQPVPSSYAASGGVAQKGPLIQGSTVTVQELDAALAPTGKQYSYQIDSDLGTFSPNSSFTSQYLSLSATTSMRYRTRSRPGRSRSTRMPISPPTRRSG
jgi:hypothetical protein